MNESVQRVAVCFRQAQVNCVGVSVHRSGDSIVRSVFGFALVAAWVVAATAVAEPPGAFQSEWQPHKCQQHDGSGGLINLEASAQVPTLKVQSVSWHHHFIYMPEKNRLLLQTGGLGWFSDDLGSNWTATTLPDCFLTYFGDGKVLAHGQKELALSDDYGLTWKTIAAYPQAPNGQAFYGAFGPMLVDKDPGSGSVVRLADPGFCNDHKAWVRFSTDGGRTWPRVVEVPWISETTLIRAGNGDIVAATRTDGTASIPDPKAPFDWRRVGGHQDFYSGLGVHISTDNGNTWSPVNKLYESGRHHASMVRMPNDDLVMSYVVRLGYPDTQEGLPQYGIEAIVSHDHGRTWNKDHRYVLDHWDGDWLDHPRGLVRLRAPNETYTVLLPDGSLITAYGTGYRVNADNTPRDIKLVRWRLNK